jgi:beta-alanine--pyruvate transaminase
MPFTDHERYKKKPKLFKSAKGMFFYDQDNREILDGAAGLWCVNAGHAHPKVVEAIQKQAASLDYAPPFNCGHNDSMKFAQKILDIFPADKKMTEVYFTVDGSSAVDTSLKMALQYHRARGEPQRLRFIGRERAYHGVNFGGVSVGGISTNRKAFAGQHLPFVDHLAHTQSLKDMAFSKGLPTWGEHLADELERLVTFHDPSTIAACIIEPVAGATGVLPPPTGYLKKIREICSKHGILLIFDEVITGFGRLGSPFATLKFDVTPDIITCAKGLTNAAVPAGAVITQSHVFDAIHSAAHKLPEMQVEFYHGYTYSAHPLAMAAGLAALDAYQNEKIWENADKMSSYWEQGLHSLKGLPNVVDIRNCGLLGAVEFTAIPGAPVKRSMDIFDRCFEKGLFMRVVGPAIALSPPLILEKKHVDRIVNTIAEAVKESNEQLK